MNWRSTEEQKAKLRAAWTPARRQAQALRAKTIPKHLTILGGQRGGATMRTPENRQAARERANRQWTPEARREAQAKTIQLLADSEFQKRRNMAMKARLLRLKEGGK